VRSRVNQRGFTLIEVVVAFAIFALSVGALYEITRDAMRRTGKADERARAWLTAESELAALRVRVTPWPPEESGVTPDGLEWRVQTSEHEFDTHRDGPWHAFDVAVRVKPKGSSGAEVLLRSVELAWVH